MFDNATINKLREMRLGVMAEVFKEQQGRTGIGSLAFEERFAFLVEAEWLSRRNKRTERLVRKAGFRFPAAIENIENGDFYIELGAYLKNCVNGQKMV